MSHSHAITPHPTHCPDCSLGAFVRNHYFTGKLLVERDFTEEQRFHIEKLRHHHQRLHGWGVVCGLKVRQHPNPACRDRYVIVEPGTAIDCCGHEILVREEVMFPFADDPDLKALVAGRRSHRLQICIRYRECPTEEIPVLFDECGCDETRCAPNRILESYELDLIVDPPERPAPDSDEVRLKWEQTILFAHSAHLALHEATQRLYAMNAAAKGVLLAVHTSNHAIVDTRVLPAKGLALTVSLDGKHVYASVEGTKPGDAPEILTLDANNLASPPVATLSMGTAADKPTVLAIAPDQRLFALFAPSGDVAVWDDPETSGAPGTVIHLSANLQGLTFSTDGQRAYIADATNHHVRSIDIQAAPPVAAADLAVDPAALPSCLALAPSTAGDTLAVGDETNKKLYLVTLDGSKPVKAADLTHHPVAVIPSPGGKWIYALERDHASPEKWFVEPVNTVRVQLDLPGQLGALVPVGENAVELALSKSGKILYAVFDGDSGGISILNITDEDCAELLWQGLDGCPSCDTANCIVLATIENYDLGDQLEDQTDPLTDPHADAGAHIARIDNRQGRRLLPSTQVLTEVIRCLLEHEGGGKGGQGPPGLTGPKGDPGIDKVEVIIVDCRKDASGTIEIDPDGTRILKLVIPSGCKKDELTHICAINWQHGSRTKLGLIKEQGFRILFDGPVLRGDLHDQSFMVLTQSRSDEGTVCWCEMVGTVKGGNFETVCDPSSFFTSVDANADPVNGAVFTPRREIQQGVYRVVLKGDYIRSVADKRAVDADHLPAWLPDRKTGDGVEGGTFESWLILGR
jgi:DNA-binding beta-propeller fold protein YncE